MSFIREATNDLHTELEALPFNVKMFKGEQTDEERRAYLTSNKYIFTALDPHVPPELRRLKAIEKDLKVLGGPSNFVLGSSIDYSYYLQHHCENIGAHIYLNYMGFMYGGQIMKKRYPTSASMYEFDEIEAKREYIREQVCEDTEEFVNEVRNGFHWHINISKELGRYFRVVG